jgi:hypothetical protein
MRRKQEDGEKKSDKRKEEGNEKKEKKKWDFSNLEISEKIKDNL